MRLKTITATPHPSGNRIDLRWENPEKVKVLVMRREDTYPGLPEDGDKVAEGEGLNFVADKGLKGETVYYYTLFPYKDDPPGYHFDHHNRAAAMATSPYNMAGQMYDLLPGIYKRYDTVLPVKTAGMPEEDKQKGQLRRFLDLPGSQLDQLYSMARAMLDLYHIDKTDGRLLPLLAQWIGWQLDYTQEIEVQRNEIRSAPHLYRTIGLIPSAEAAVKRLLGWECRTKEFMHNVFLSNRPERLNLWIRHLSHTSDWPEPPKLLSLDFAYEGRPTAVQDGEGTLWFFYHTLRRGRWDIWYKRLVTFSLGLTFSVQDQFQIDKFQSELDEGVLSSDLRQAFEEAGISLSESATVMIKEKHNLWLITDEGNEQTYTARKEGDVLNVYNQGEIDKFQSELDEGILSSGLRQAFEEAGISLSQSAAVMIEEKHNLWLITDEDNGQTYTVRKEEDGLEDGQIVYKLSTYKWEPSQPLNLDKHPAGAIQVNLDKHPTAAIQDATLWVFWDTFDETNRTWRISYCTLADERWSSIENFGSYGAGIGWVLLHSWSEQYKDHCTVDFTKTPIDTKYRTWHIEKERRIPWTTVDNDSGLWLFWLEKIKGDIKWQLKYNIHKDTRWALDPATFPLDEGKDPRVESDLFVLFHPDQKIWVFWARKEYSGGPWEIAYRVKEGKDPKASDWSEIYILPKSKFNSGHHDREPAAFVNNENKIELFWSSSQDGSWSVWHGILENREISRENAKRITDNLYSHRNPLPLQVHDESGNGEDAWLIYRSNESLMHTSEVYGSTITIDSRYAGSTTVESGNLAKISTMRRFEDFLTYTYDTGRNGQQSEEGWYARDTVGIYLRSNTEDKWLTNLNRQPVENVLKQFLPIQMRAVFIIEKQNIYEETIYSSAQPVGERFVDLISCTTREEYSGLRDTYLKDTAVDWEWLHSWSREFTHYTVDFDTDPIDITFRTWHIALRAGRITCTTREEYSGLGDTHYKDTVVD